MNTNRLTYLVTFNELICMQKTSALNCQNHMSTTFLNSIILSNTDKRKHRGDITNNMNEKQY